MLIFNNQFSQPLVSPAPFIFYIFSGHFVHYTLSCSFCTVSFDELEKDERFSFNETTADMEKSVNKMVAQARYNYREYREALQDVNQAMTMVSEVV